MIGQQYYKYIIPLSSLLGVHNNTAYGYDEGFLLKRSWMRAENWHICSVHELPQNIYLKFVELKLSMEENA